jgi:hypothetical protein
VTAEIEVGPYAKIPGLEAVEKGITALDAPAARNRLRAQWDVVRLVDQEEITMPATYDDANLVMQIVRWGSEMNLPDSVKVVLEDGFDPEKASTDDPNVQKILGFGEVIGTLVNQGVLDRGLALDMWWIQGLWARVAPAAKRQREHLGEPRLSENFEKLAAG